MGSKNGKAMKSRVTEVPPRQREFPNDLNNRAVMDLDRPSMKDALLRMIGRITPNFALRQDLLQEALIHLWLRETRRPGQTRSWYLQSVKFHLQHCLSSGRSVDSIKRGRGHSHFEHDFEQTEELAELVDPGDSVVSQAGMRDIISLLSPHLCPHENAVLDCLADGLGVREIGRRLQTSHTMVIKHRSKIAALLVKFERPSLLNDQLHPSNGARNSNGITHTVRSRTANGAKSLIGLKQGNGSNHTNGGSRIQSPECLQGVDHASCRRFGQFNPKTTALA